MRIGQLARQLGISPSDISGFLATQNIETETGANARLDEEVVAKVLQHFAPEKKVEEIVQEEEPAPVKEEPLKTDEALPVEVIRVTKVELQGLKVVGKIDLPQPKKKEEAPVPPREQREPRREPRREQRSWKNPMEQ